MTSFRLEADIHLEHLDMDYIYADYSNECVLRLGNNSKTSIYSSQTCLLN